MFGDEYGDDSDMDDMDEDDEDEEQIVAMQAESNSHPMVVSFTWGISGHIDFIKANYLLINNSKGLNGTF